MERQHGPKHNVYRPGIATGPTPTVMDGWVCSRPNSTIGRSIFGSPFGPSVPGWLVVLPLGGTIRFIVLVSPASHGPAFWGDQ